MNTDSNNTEQKRLDKLNTERIETTRKRVAHAIRLINNPISCLNEGRSYPDHKTDIAHAINLLETAVEELRWACDHFSWDTATADQIDEAAGLLGTVLAEYEIDEDPLMMGYSGAEALAKLGYALATLTRWFDDDQDVSEV